MMRLDPAFLAKPLAHRALHDVQEGRPENSRAAISAALNAGYGIEIDVQLSADGVPMVFHDYDLGRLSYENGPLRQRSSADLSSVILRGGDEGIPTLSDILQLVAGRAPLLVEIKDQDGAMGPDVGDLERAVAAALQGYDGPVAVMSFNPHSVQQMSLHAPQVPRGLVTSAYRAEDWGLLPSTTRDTLRDIPDFESTGACFISHEVDDLDRDRVTELKQAGASILCWTVRSKQQEILARQNADNVTFEGYLA